MNQTNANRFKNILLYVAVIVVLLWALAVFTGGNQQGQVSYASVVDCFEAGQVSRFTVDGDGVLTMEPTIACACASDNSNLSISLSFAICAFWLLRIIEMTSSMKSRALRRPCKI